ncbi:hypothetical protein [uncultured Microscilla sp.]|uniref:hypothetical protein n=1 Tax=uncultured Microscilla sp. TaxID=432653 RepID=UPI002623E907|nr:hypothetical protein [uncultured Microscilla sp.]
MVYRDNKFIRIELDQDNKIALVKSKSFINDKEYQRSWYALADLLLEHQINKLLINDQDTKVVSLKSVEWLMQNILPKLLASMNNLTAALVPPEDIFYQVSIQNLQGQIDNQPNFSDKITVKWFEQPDEALEWLKSS